MMLRPGIYKLNQVILGAAVADYATPWFEGLAGMQYVAALANFVRSSGGTSLDLRLQTSLDQGATAMDIMHFAFTTTTAKKVKAILAKEQASDLTPGDNALTGGGVVAVLGDRLRWKWTSVGIYVGTLDLSLNVW